LKIFEFLSAKDFDLEETEENEDTLEGNALLKAKNCYEHTGLPSLSDDTGLFINSLGGFPGVHCGRIAGPSGNRDYKKASKMFHEKLGDSPDRSCAFACAIAFVADGLEIVVRGDMPGTFVYPGAFGICDNGYNPYFRPEGCELTYAQTGFMNENVPHHRLTAARNLIKKLREIGAV
jgi:XTP/dITP diphosphohydrolase